MHRWVCVREQVLQVLRHVLARAIRQDTTCASTRQRVRGLMDHPSTAHVPGWYENARTPVSAYSAWTSSANRFTADLVA
jgi:hypothetical protein